MKIKENKKKATSSNSLSIIFFIIIGGLCGYFGADLLDLGSGDINATTILMKFAELIIIIYLAIYLHIIVHEGGHLVFGKATGYHFVSFRVMKLMLVSVNGRYKFKKFNIVGTGGQCLMMPPKGDGYEYPFLLYNFGGVIANIVIASVSLILLLLLPDIQFLTMFLLFSTLLGFPLALINGIPLRLGGIGNDGYNARSMRKDREARRSLWTQLYINALMTNGQRLRDLPSELFEIPDNLDLTNPLNCSLLINRFSYLLDRNQYADAKNLCDYILEKVPGLMGLNRNELNCEYLFFEIIGQRRSDEIDHIYTKKLKQYIKATSSYVSRIRLMYAYELLVKQNEATANKQLSYFEKAAKTYPYPGEVESERETIDYITKLVEQKSNG